MTAPNYQVKKTNNVQKPFKVFPKDVPTWDDEKPENFFPTQTLAQIEADNRNNMFNMIWVPEQE